MSSLVTDNNRITYPITVVPAVVPAQTSAAIMAPTTPVAATHTLAAVTQTSTAMTAPTTAMAVAQVSCPGPDCKAPETSGPLTTMPAANWGMFGITSHREVEHCANACY